MSEAQIQEAISSHELRNAALRRLFIEKKVDLSEERQIECHFWAWSRQDAADLAEELMVRGFSILTQRLVAPPHDPALWNLEANIKQSIELTLRREFTDELVRVAASQSGRYDGWGTLV